MPKPRTLRAYLPLLVGGTAMFLALLSVAWLSLPTSASAIAAYFFAILARSALHHRIILLDGGIHVHDRSGITITVPSGSIDSLRFSSNALVVTSTGGIAVTMTTPWYTGRQRDAVVAHVRATSV